MQNVAFLSVGAPITDKIFPKPNNTLASTLPFQQTVPTEPNPNNGQFFLDVERTVKNFPLTTAILQSTNFASSNTFNWGDICCQRQSQYSL